MGVAVGYAAAICKEYAITPRDLYRSPERTTELQARITGTWPTKPPAVGVPVGIVDNADAAGLTVTGSWTASSYDAGYHATNYMHDGNTAKGTKSVVFRPALTAASSYEVFLKWASSANRATNTPVTITTKPGLPPVQCIVNQQLHGGQWFSLGVYELDPATAAVTVSNTGTNGYVVADAVLFASPAGQSTTDRDSDGLPDWWERWYFLSETAASPTLDSDGDGHSNSLEFRTGCDPNNPTSRFDARMAIDQQSGGCALRWPSAEGRTYRIESSPDCRSWTPMLENISATPPENQYTAPVSGSCRFFRIVVEP
jgi:hypothetical protein